MLFWIDTILRQQGSWCNAETNKIECFWYMTYIMLHRLLEVACWAYMPCVGYGSFHQDVSRVQLSVKTFLVFVELKIKLNLREKCPTWHFCIKVPTTWGRLRRHDVSVTFTDSEAQKAHNEQAFRKWVIDSWLGIGMAEGVGVGGTLPLK